ncbi:DUF2490 domain-containing protein [Flavobacterium sp.]|uniref:DUF2490 domain-containing protein n=1 Tax=Flavobacterium sp. TaxID=239 RepID=UPI002FDE340E
MKIKILFLLMIFCHVSFSQTQQDQRVWMAYTGQYKASPNLGYHMEAQFRMDNQLEQNQQNLFRVGVIYHFSESQNATAGYALVNTFSAARDDFFKENRIWEQYQITKKWSKDILINRFRLEQRWVEQLRFSELEGVTSETAYQNRFRVLNRFLWYMTHLKSEKESFYFFLQNELFVTLGENEVNSKVLDQNRLLVGFGLNYNNTIRLELGYLNHYITSSTANDLMNHTVSISLFHNIVL